MIPVVVDVAVVIIIIITSIITGGNTQRNKMIYSERDQLADDEFPLSLHCIVDASFFIRQSHMLHEHISLW